MQAGRVARNIAEKQRRDKLNSFINELANTVPLVVNASKRLDKTSILRLSAAYLRLHNSPLCAEEKKYGSTRKEIEDGQRDKVINWRPNDFKLNHLKTLMEAVDGFVVVSNSEYKLLYVSTSCEKYLGHQNIDMMGYSLIGFIHPGDVETVKTEIEAAKDDLLQRGRLSSDRIFFRCRMRERNQPRTEVITYQVVQIVGNLSFSFEVASTNESEAQWNPKSTLKNMSELPFNDVIRTSKRSMTFNPLDYLLFKGFVQIIPTSSMAELSLIDSNLEEYVSRLALDGTLLFADHRISMITGHMPFEVVKKSAYDFILNDDHAISIFAHKLMLSSSNGTGIIVHKLKTKNNGFVFLQSAGCLQYDRDTGQVDHFICVSRLLVEEEGDKEREKFVKRFTPHISNSSAHSLYQSLQIVIGPRNSNAYYTQKSLTSEDTSDSSMSEMHPKTCSTPDDTLIINDFQITEENIKNESITSEENYYYNHYEL